MKAKQPPGEPMTLGNMRKLGVQRLVACCLNPHCLHEGLIDVSKIADEIEVPSFPAAGRGFPPLNSFQTDKIPPYSNLPHTRTNVNMCTKWPNKRGRCWNSVGTTPENGIRIAECPPG